MEFAAVRAEVRAAFAFARFARAWFTLDSNRCTSVNIILSSNLLSSRRREFIRVKASRYVPASMYLSGLSMQSIFHLEHERDQLTTPPVSFQDSVLRRSFSRS